MYAPLTIFRQSAPFLDFFKPPPELYNIYNPIKAIN